MISPLPPRFDAALRDVQAEQARFRVAAASRLADPPDARRDEAIAGLLSLADDPIGAVREAAYESLGLLQVREALPRLLRAFEDSHPGARQAAVLAIARAAPEECDRACAPLLDDPRPEMRFASVWAFASLGDAHATEIARALRDPDLEVRALALQCLGDLGAVDQADAIADLLRDPAEAIRFAAATSLAALGDGRGAHVLRPALRNPDKALPAAIGLGDLADREARDELARLARHRWRSPILRAAAARALVRLGDPLGTAVIRRLVRSWRIEARQYAVQLVGELGLTALVPDLARSWKRSRRSERAVYETTLEQLAPLSAQAGALLASIRAADHPV